MVYCYDYPRPAVTVDCVVFGIDDQPALKVLLIQRQLSPFVGAWALPGGFVREQEDLVAAARRELREETQVEGVFLAQLHTFGKPGRDPRGQVISVAYYALVNLQEYQIRAATDAKAVAWFAIADLPTLAFDHQEIIIVAIATLRTQIRHAPIGFELLPEKFTLTQLQRLYEIIWGQSLDKRNFRKKFLKMGLLIALDEKERQVAHRAAQLYQFDQDRYQALRSQGFNFEI